MLLFEKTSSSDLQKIASIFNCSIVSQFSDFKLWNSIRNIYIYTYLLLLMHSGGVSPVVNIYNLYGIYLFKKITKWRRQFCWCFYCKKYIFHSYLYKCFMWKLYSNTTRSSKGLFYVISSLYLKSLHVAQCAVVRAMEVPYFYPGGGKCFLLCKTSRCCSNRSINSIGATFLYLRRFKTIYFSRYSKYIMIRSFL